VSTWTTTDEPRGKNRLRFRVAPAARGQVVEHSYAIDRTAGALWRRTIDHGDPQAAPVYATRQLTAAEIGRNTAARRVRLWDAL
jgi:hypothetical protein